jgi:hypothetical protein
MKSFVPVVFLFVFGALSPAAAQSTVKEFATQVGSAYQGKTLKDLDGQKVTHGSFSVTIRHDMGGKPVTRTFKSFASFDTWLGGHYKGEGPAFTTPDLKGCSGGTCSFDTSSLLHNNLYLKSIAYGHTQGRYFVKSISLLDGD